jgi:hypothetical protein
LIVSIDHGSVYVTRAYLAGLSRSGQWVHLYHFGEPAHPKWALITFTVKTLPPVAESDGVFLLGAGGLLLFPDAETFRSRRADTGRTPSSTSAVAT